MSRNTYIIYCDSTSFSSILSSISPIISRIQADDNLALRGDEKEDRQQSERNQKKDEVSRYSEQDRAGRRTENETDDHAVVMHGFGKFARRMFFPAVEESFGSAAQISGAHRGGEGQSVHLPEGLYLKRADKRDQGVDDEIELSVGNETDRQKTENFQKDDGLVPGDFPSVRQFSVNDFRDKYAERIGEDRKQITTGSQPVPFREIESEKHHVSGYGIGEHLSAVEIGVDIEESPYDAQNAGCRQPFRIGMDSAFHIVLPFCSRCEESVI